jgi:hypothetical protein
MFSSQMVLEESGFDNLRVRPLIVDDGEALEVLARV